MRNLPLCSKYQQETCDQEFEKWEHHQRTEKDVKEISFIIKQTLLFTPQFFVFIQLLCVCYGVICLSAKCIVLYKFNYDKALS